MTITFAGSMDCEVNEMTKMATRVLKSRRIFCQGISVNCSSVKKKKGGSH